MAKERQGHENSQALKVQVPGPVISTFQLPGCFSHHPTPVTLTEQLLQQQAGICALLAASKDALISNTQEGLSSGHIALPPHPIHKHQV